MSPQRTIIAVDWSARSAPSSVKPAKDAIYACVSRPDVPSHPVYFRTRTTAMQWLDEVLETELSDGRQVLVGFDFAFGYPAGFAEALTGKPDPLAVWDWLEARIEDGPDNANNRFEVAADLNARFAGIGPFWGCPTGLGLKGLPEKGNVRSGHGMIEKRLVEQETGAQTVWKLFTTGSVGSQTLMGLPWLARLRRRLGDRCFVWPFESGLDMPKADVVLVEIYPSAVRMHYQTPLATRYPDQLYDIPDAEQVRAVCDEYARWTPACWDQMLMLGGVKNVKQVCEEGWILGVPLRHEEAA